MGSTRLPGRAGPVVVTLLAVLCLVTAPASAAPVPDKQTQADQLAQQLDDQGQHIAALDEQYNQAQAKADAISQQLADIEPMLADSNQALAAARQRLSQASVDAYVHGGSTPLLGALLKSSASDFGVRKTYVNAALDEQRGALAQFDAARRKLLKTRDQLRAAQTQARAAAAAIDANRKAIEATVAAQQATMQQVTQPGMASLVAQASASRAQQQQAQGKTHFDQLAAPPPPPTTTAPRAPAPAAPTKPAGGSGSGPVTTARPATPPTTAAPKPPTSTPVGPAPPVKPGATTAVNTAKAQLGKPYVWAAAGPDSYDCSGLTMYAWHAGGVSLAHSAAMQYDETARIALSQLAPGDLVFFYTPIEHVGIYVGGGQMIDAPYTGAVVRYDSIYNPALVGAGRP
ncbi:MAG: C40 family peptidase [Acidimicrobiia bacterium]|nr:C40 family peptidase [Acidimicrobiia bacterium]